MTVLECLKFETRKDCLRSVKIASCLGFLHDGYTNSSGRKGLRSRAAHDPWHGPMVLQAKLRLMLLRFLESRSFEPRVEGVWSRTPEHLLFFKCSDCQCCADWVAVTYCWSSFHSPQYLRLSAQCCILHCRQPQQVSEEGEFTNSIISF